MQKNRLEAFSDGVLAIIITIMVLELKLPDTGHGHASTFADLQPMLPVLLSYVLSFIYVGIYWNNHHHLLHAARHVTGGILWANLYLLFWLSLFPISTHLIGENHHAPAPAALYGFVLLMAAIAYYFLQRLIIKEQGRDGLLKKAVGHDWKGKVSPLMYLAAIPLAYVNPWISIAIYVVMAGVWFIPDRRIEKEIEKQEG